jgi:hypothetical protein
MRLNFERRQAETEPEDGRFMSGEAARFVHAAILDESGQEITNIEAGNPIRLTATIEALTRIENPLLGFTILNADNVQIFSPTPLSLSPDERVLEPGQRAQVEIEVENPLSSGHYYVHLVVARMAPEMEPIAFRKHAADFVIFGARPFAGLITLDVKSNVRRVDPG